MKRVAGILLMMLLVVLLWEVQQHQAWREEELDRQRREVAELELRMQALVHEKDLLQEALMIRIREVTELTDQVDRLSTIPAVVTAYAPLDPRAVEGVCYEGNPRVTATGTEVRVGVVAADLSRLPAGTQLQIPGYGLGVVEDTGSAMRRAEGLLLDVFMETREEALRWGRQSLDVRIVLDGEKGDTP